MHLTPEVRNIDITPIDPPHPPKVSSPAFAFAVAPYSLRPNPYSLSFGKLTKCPTAPRLPTSSPKPPLPNPTRSPGSTPTPPPDPPATLPPPPPTPPSTPTTPTPRPTQPS